MLPIIADITENEWTKIAENVKDIYIKKLKTMVNATNASADIAISIVLYKI